VAVLVALSCKLAADDEGPAPYRDTTPIDTAALSPQLEDLTWTEVRALIASGTRTVLIPTGGTEQNGPHMVLGKHNFIVRETAERVARALGKTLVAPVLAYVPEGDIETRTGHMAFPGTISVPERTFEQVLEATARSLRVHGFLEICLLGDSGDSQRAQQRVARRLNAEWQRLPARVLHVSAYYADNGQLAWLRSQGESAQSIGTHAGIRDTSELLAVRPAGVRMERARSSERPEMRGAGVAGDPARASAERGKKLLELKVRAATRQIRAWRHPQPPH
jgi:creatinine amidohydrolase/Fe(II)-dependent formamide hydrolase-like protein